MTKQLYKVSAPRLDMTFSPNTFWHTSDWESSTTRRREGYIREELLYAGDFDEVNLHLFPRVRTVRVRSPIKEAIKRWNVQVCYVDDLDKLIDRLSDECIYFDEQT